MNNIGSINVKKSIWLGLLIIILFSAFSFQPAAVASGTRADSDLVINSHIIQVFQLDESPNIIVFQETMTINNTSNSNYTGTVLFSVQNPMYMICVLNDSIELNAFKVVDGIFAVELVGNNTISSWQNFELFLEYAINFESESKPQLMTIDKEIQYKTSLIMYIIRPVGDYEVSGNGITLTKATSAEFAGAYVSPHSPPVSAERGDKIGLEFIKNPEESDEPANDFSMLLIAAIIIILLIVITLAFMIISRKQRNKATTHTKKAGVKSGHKEVGTRAGLAVERKKGLKTTNDTEKKSSTGAGGQGQRQKLVEDKKKILQAKKKIKTWQKSGKLSSEEFTRMDIKYKAKLKDINKKITRLDKQTGSGKIELDADSGERLKTGSDKELDVLLARKKTLLSVIKNLERDYKAGTLPDDVYDELKTEYKQEAIEVLKKIDELQ